MGKMLLVAALTLSLAACAQPGSGGYGLSKQTGGAILGGAGGAVAGAQFGKGKGQLATTALGALLGAFVGSEAGASMDRADQTYYAQQPRGAYYPPPQRQSWSEPQGYWTAPPRY